jgi:SAM-dependent methyltransferase
VFAPWAEVLRNAAVIVPGCQVLDIASETGVVARAAAKRAGPGGRVVAGDASAAMPARLAAVSMPGDAAPIEPREAPVGRPHSHRSTPAWSSFR